MYFTCEKTNTFLLGKIRKIKDRDVLGCAVILDADTMEEKHNRTQRFREQHTHLRVTGVSWFQLGQARCKDN